MSTRETILISKVLAVPLVAVETPVTIPFKNPELMVDIVPPVAAGTTTLVVLNPTVTPTPMRQPKLVKLVVAIPTV